MKVLVILGHPRNNSYTAALAEAYIDGALRAGMQVDYLQLEDLEFDPDVHRPDPHRQYAEPDIVRSRELIKAADHLVFVFPVWWASFPAKLKAFMDRVFVPGFSFYETRPGEYKQLLKGRTAQLLCTMDTPGWAYNIFLRSPAKGSLKTGTLNLCGVSPVKTKYFTPVTHATEQERHLWLKEAEQMGYALKDGVHTWWDKFSAAVVPWLKALRLQFYPMSWFAYAVGAFTAAAYGTGYNRGLFWLGYLFLFLLEAATVFINEKEDFDTDVANKNYGPFSGGSRVLVNEELTVAQLKNGIRFTLIGTLITGAASIFLSAGNLPATSSVLAMLAVLALGYTLPPLKLSYRTLGEVTVGITHSIGVLLAGYVLQGGPLSLSAPWLVGLPLFLSILPAIILSGIPDHSADKAAGKLSVAVRFGKDNAAVIAMICVLLSLITVLVIYFMNPAPGAYNWTLAGAVVHGGVLLLKIRAYLQTENRSETINGLMVWALTYLLWFVLIPFFCLR